MVARPPIPMWRVMNQAPSTPAVPPVESDTSPAVFQRVASRCQVESQVKPEKRRFVTRIERSVRQSRIRDPATFEDQVGQVIPHFGRQNADAGPYQHVAQPVFVVHLS